MSLLHPDPSHFRGFRTWVGKTFVRLTSKLMGELITGLPRRDEPLVIPTRSRPLIGWADQNDIKLSKCTHFGTTQTWLTFYHSPLSVIKWPRSGVTYVFISFPPRPPPQKLLPLTSKLLELHLRYLGQRIYWSDKMYWMTFPWPWPEVTTVASISRNLLVGTVKWEQLIRSLQNVLALE